MSRNEDTLQPTVYLNKLPDAFEPDARVLVTDPMLATGERERLAVAAGCILTACVCRWFAVHLFGRAHSSRGCRRQHPRGGRCGGAAGVEALVGDLSWCVVLHGRSSLGAARS